MCLVEDWCWDHFNPGVKDVCESEFWMRPRSLRANPGGSRTVHPLVAMAGFVRLLQCCAQIPGFAIGRILAESPGEPPVIPRESGLLVDGVLEDHMPSTAWMSDQVFKGMIQVEKGKCCQRDPLLRVHNV